MSTLVCPDRVSFQRALEESAPGDCVRAESFAAVFRNVRELLSGVGKLAEKDVRFLCEAEGVDTDGAQGEFFLGLCRAMAELERAERREKQQSGIERAREQGKYKGRRPIAVDEKLFDAVVELWQNGEISARQAMSRLDLKPNTFYRRIKEREEQKMKDYKKMEKDIKNELKEASRQSRKELDELKKQVRTEAREIKKAAEEKLDAHDVEREIRKEKIRAEAEHVGEMIQMKKDMEAETKELKKLLEND